jgi:hypothetical protein
VQGWMRSLSTHEEAFICAADPQLSEFTGSFRHERHAVVPASDGAMFARKARSSRLSTRIFQKQQTPKVIRLADRSHSSTASMSPIPRSIPMPGAGCLQPCHGARTEFTENCGTLFASCISDASWRLSCEEQAGCSHAAWHHWRGRSNAH